MEKKFHLIMFIPMTHVKLVKSLFKNYLKYDNVHFWF